MKLSEILDVEVPVPKIPDASTDLIVMPMVTAGANNTPTEDAIDARTNIRTLISQGTHTLNELLILAKDLKTPRSYEIISGFIQTLANLNHDLMDIHNKEILITNNEDPAVPGDVNIGTAVFVGSTADLSELVKLKRAQRYANTITVKAESVSDIQAETSLPEILP